MPFYKPSEIAKTLRVSTQTVLRLIDEGRLKANKIGNRYRIDAGYLTDYLNDTSTDPTEAVNESEVA